MRPDSIGCQLPFCLDKYVQISWRLLSLEAYFPAQTVLQPHTLQLLSDLCDPGFPD